MDLLDFSRIFFALIAVLGMIGLCAMIAKKIGFASGAIGLQKKRRLAIVETLPLDARRRAAIIRCDGREHLVIIGQTGETLIEANIPACVLRDAPSLHPEDFAGQGPAKRLEGRRGGAPQDEGGEKFNRTNSLNFAEAIAKLQKFNPYQKRSKPEAKAA